MVLLQLWEALEKRLDRELDDGAGSSGSSDGDSSHSSSEDDGSDSVGSGRGGNQAAPQQEQQPAAGFQLFGCETHATGGNLGCDRAPFTRACQAAFVLWPLS